MKIDNLETPDRRLEPRDVERGGDLWLVLVASGFTSRVPTITHSATLRNIATSIDDFLFYTYRGYTLSLGMHCVFRGPTETGGLVPPGSLPGVQFEHLSTKHFLINQQGLPIGDSVARRFTTLDEATETLLNVMGGTVELVDNVLLASSRRQLSQSHETAWANWYAIVSGGKETVCDQ